MKTQKRLHDLDGYYILLYPADLCFLGKERKMKFTDNNKPSEREWPSQYKSLVS